MCAVLVTQVGQKDNILYVCSYLNMSAALRDTRVNLKDDMTQVRRHQYTWPGFLSSHCNGSAGPAVGQGCESEAGSKLR